MLEQVDRWWQSDIVRSCIADRSSSNEQARPSMLTAWNWKMEQ